MWGVTCNFLLYVLLGCADSQAQGGVGGLLTWEEDSLRKDVRHGPYSKAEGQAIRDAVRPHLSATSTQTHLGHRSAPVSSIVLVVRDYKTQSSNLQPFESKAITYADTIKWLGSALTLGLL